MSAASDRKRFASAVPAMVAVSMTPELARACLDHARANRSVRPSHVSQLALQMRQGEWDESVPQPIGFDKLGRLCDGQHRCLAVLESGCTVEMWAALGLDEHTILKLDAGKHRTTADRFLAFTSDRLVRELVDGKPGRAKHAASIANLIHQALAATKLRSVESSIRIVRMFHVEMRTAIDQLGNCNHTRRAAVVSAFTMAWYYVNGTGDDDLADELQLLGARLVSGEHLSGTGATLNRYLHAQLARQSRATRGPDSTWLQFTKTLRAVQNILSGEPPQAKLIHSSRPRRIFRWYFGDVDRIVQSLKIQPQLELVE